MERLEELEKVARLLEPSPEDRSNIRESIIEYGDSFLGSIYEAPAYIKPTGTDPTFPPIGESMSIDRVTDIINKQIDTEGLNPASGGHLGYIPGGGIYYAALGDYIADITNRYAGVHYAGPGAVSLEHHLIDWMRDMVGYPDTTGGNLTTGGSLANLIAIVTARDASGISSVDFKRSVIYQTNQAHHSIDKAVRIAGLGEAQVRYVNMDEGSRMDPAHLSDLIAADIDNGNRPLMVVASAGSTDTGSVDPLDQIADVCEEHDVWMHVDGAYGAFFMLVDSLKDKFKGIERSDSVIMDPHKGLFLPYGLGTVLVRDVEKLYNSHFYNAPYLQDAKKRTSVYSPADLSPELTKHFRGLRLWVPLMLHGIEPFKACLEEKVLLTRYFLDEVGKIEGMEIGPEPDLSVGTFRYIPETGDANKFNEDLIDLVYEDGRVFLTSTMLNGNFTLRLAALSFRTHKDTIDLTLEVLRTGLNTLLN